MGESELDPSPSNSNPSQISMGFPPYRRSHLRSNTYNTLLGILSHLSASHQLNIQDNGSGGVGQEKQEKRLECPEFVVSDFMDPKDPIPQKEMQVHETIEGGGDRGGEFGADRVVLSDRELMIGTEKVEDSLRSQRQPVAMSMQEIDFNIDKRIMDELELVLKGSEEPVGDSDLIPLNSGLGEKQNGNSEAELMGYQVEHVEFQHSDVKISRNASTLEVQGELDQHALEGFHPSLMFNMSTSSNGQISASVVSTSSIKHEKQQKEMELVKAVCSAVDSLPSAEGGDIENEEPCRQKVAEPMQLSLNQDMTSEALNVREDGRFMNSAILEDKNEMQHEEEKLEKLICANNATNSSNISIEKGDAEEGEISGDFGVDGNLFDISSVDSLILQQKKMDEVQKPKTAVENMVFPSKIGNGEKEEGYESNSFIVNALQDGHNSGQVEPRTCNKNGIAGGLELAFSWETFKYVKAGECGSVLKSGNSKDKQIRSQGLSDLPTNLAQNQVLHRGLLEDATKDHGNSYAVKQQKVDLSSKKKRGPGSVAKQAKKKQKKRKKRAEQNKQLGVKRLKLPLVQKPKTIIYCRHYLSGRCHEGDKCQFSHDTVPLTKSSPCCHFARHSCMKGDDCPFDHQLSKYPCNNFVSKGSCGRGDACMFSHQLPTKQDIPTPSSVNRPELKSQFLSGNTNFSMPLNNRGCSSVQQNHFTNSMGIHSHIGSERKVMETVQKQSTPAPKGISFINVAKSSLLGPSTPKPGMITPNKGSLVQIGTCTDQSASGTNQTSVEVPKKLSTVTPKGINFLSFGKGSICSFKSSTSSLSNRQNGIKLSKTVNFGLPDQASSSLDKDYYSKVSDGTKRSVPQTDLFSNEVLDTNKTVAEGMKLSFPGKASLDEVTTNLQCSLYSHEDHSHSKSIQEGTKASDNSQTSTVTSSAHLVSPFVSHPSSECLASRYLEHASNSGQRALFSTLAFAAEHESDIKMKCPAGASPV